MYETAQCGHIHIHTTVVSYRKRFFFLMVCGVLQDDSHPIPMAPVVRVWLCGHADTSKPVPLPSQFQIPSHSNTHGRFRSGVLVVLSMQYLMEEWFYNPLTQFPVVVGDMAIIYCDRLQLYLFLTLRLIVFSRCFVQVRRMAHYRSQPGINVATLSFQVLQFPRMGFWGLDDLPLL